MDSPTPHPPIRLAILGAGDHSRRFHLPALAHYRGLHPDTIELTALVEPNLSTATNVAAEFGFARVFGNVEELLAAVTPDACLVLTPAALNASLAVRLARHRLPLLIEKPPGANIAEARQLVADVAALNAKMMVSMNRRFDPLLRAALTWIDTRPINEVKATMARLARTEPEFVAHTGLHIVDVVRAIGGTVTSCQARREPTRNGNWFQATLGFSTGATGLIDLMPTAGITSESVRIAGPDYRVEIRSAEFDRGGWRAWQNRRLVVDETLPPTTPRFIANGTFAETEAFITALTTGQNFSPTPADVLPSMELCQLIEEARDTLTTIQS